MLRCEIVLSRYPLYIGLQKLGTNHTWYYVCDTVAPTYTNYNQTGESQSGFACSYMYSSDGTWTPNNDPINGTANGFVCRIGNYSSVIAMQNINRSEERFSAQLCLSSFIIKSMIYLCSPNDSSSKTCWEMFTTFSLASTRYYCKLTYCT